LLTLTAGVGAGVLAFLPAAKDARWDGPILFDRPVRHALRADDESTRKSVRSFGDKTYFAAPVIPLLVDSLVVSLIVRRDTTAAANLAAISAESFAYTGVLTFSALRGVARQRPDSSECRRTAVDPDSCGNDDTESFYSGHTAVTATAAGLVCATHTRMPLWGHPFADAAACGLAVAGAVATGTSRIIADRHYPTDVMLGLGLGFGIGYAVPVLWHFERHNKTQLSLSADPHCSGPCVALRGSF
jgi:membrane-associated phospholipid phosphatase